MAAPRIVDAEVIEAKVVPEEAEPDVEDDGLESSARKLAAQTGKLADALAGFAPEAAKSLKRLSDVGSQVVEAGAGVGRAASELKKKVAASLGSEARSMLGRK